MAVKPIPEGYHTLTPYFTVRDAVRAIEFYKQAFGAQERGVMKGPDGKVMHAELMKAAEVTGVGFAIFELDPFAASRADPAFGPGFCIECLFCLTGAVWSHSNIRRVSSQAGCHVARSARPYGAARYSASVTAFSHFVWPALTSTEKRCQWGTPPGTYAVSPGCRI